MSVSAALLRALLCLLLVLNGTGSAVASVRMSLDAEMPGTPAVADDGASTVPPCHDATEPAPPVPSTLSDQAAAGDHGHHDCCDSSGQCGDACVQHAATPPVAPTVAATMPPRPAAGVLPQGRASPALGNLIRPPIG